MNRTVTIIGGGLSGLTLGVGLRQRGVPVTVREARRYPHHRVCGEFISGRGLETLTRLGLRPTVEQAGAARAMNAAFFSTANGTAPCALPEAGLCLSRFVLDDLLAREFRRLGGELCEGERSLETVFAEGVVRATGRRAQAMENGARWFGLKAHARNVSLTADLEMHVAPNGYVGLCRVDGDVVNVCGLFRRGAETPGVSSHSRELLRGLPESPLHRRLESALFDEDSFCAVAGLPLQPHAAVERAEVCVGDSVTMIPPVTGNGMSMALESAEIAIEPLAAWSRGELSWDNARRRIAQDCDTAFARRLVWARRLQTLVLSPAWQRPLVFLAGRSEFFWRLWFARTR
ncbi:MAG: FAD-dependent monooxygenase [Chloroflexi bacterium]|nr:FAD-dependent monooxygenase [Chloroflexota bacterium]